MGQSTGYAAGELATARRHYEEAMDQEIRRRCRRRSSLDEGARLKIWELQRQDQSTRCHPLDRSPRWTHTSSGSSFPSRCVALGRPGRARSRCLALALREALARASDPAARGQAGGREDRPAREGIARVAVPLRNRHALDGLLVARPRSLDRHLLLAPCRAVSFDDFGVQASFAIRRRLQERSRCSGQTDARVPGPPVPRALCHLSLCHIAAT